MRTVTSPRGLTDIWTMGFPLNLSRAVVLPRDSRISGQPRPVRDDRALHCGGRPRLLGELVLRRCIHS